MIWLAVLALGLGAGTLSGIVGFGASIMLMPALMLAFGPHKPCRSWRCRPARPSLAHRGVAAEVDWRANAFHCITASRAALGARTLPLLEPRIVEGILGLLFLMIPIRRCCLRGACASRRGSSAWSAPHRLPLGHGRLDGPINTRSFGLWAGEGRYLSTGRGLMESASPGDRVSALRRLAAGDGGARAVVGTSLMVGSGWPRPCCSSTRTSSAPSWTAAAAPAWCCVGAFVLPA
jgi:hypothetical protein